MSKGQSAEDIRTRLQEIDPYEFEDFVAELWQEEGWDTTVSQGSNDMGVDVIAEKKGTINQKLAIQAKRYSDGNKVGRPKVQQYHSLKEQDTDADAAVVVTTSSFTDKARLWAHEHNVKLVNGDDLVDMLRKHQRLDLVDEYAPPLDEIDSGDSTSMATSESSSSSSTTSPSDSMSTGFGIVAGGLGLWAVTLIFQFNPEASFTLPVMDVLWGLCGLTLILFPIGMFMDASHLHAKDADWKPNRVIWPIAGLMLIVVGALAYVLFRFDRT